MLGTSRLAEAADGPLHGRTDLCTAGADDVVTTLGQARSDLMRLMPAPERVGAEDERSIATDDGVGLAASSREAS